MFDFFFFFKDLIFCYFVIRAKQWGFRAHCRPNCKSPVPHFFLSITLHNIHSFALLAREIIYSYKRPEKEQLLKSLSITIKSQFANGGLAQMKDGRWILFFSFTLLFALLKFHLTWLVLWLNLRQSRSPGSTFSNILQHNKMCKTSREVKWYYKVTVQYVQWKY